MLTDMNTQNLINRLKTNPDNMETSSLLREFAREASPAELRNLFVKCEKLGLPVAGLIFTMMISLYQNGFAGTAEAIIATMPESHTHYEYYSACGWVRDFRNFNAADGAVALRAFTRTCAAKNFERVADADKITKNSFLLEELDWPRKWSIDKVYGLPPLEILRDAGRTDSPYTCLTVCDARAFEKSAPSFVKNVRANCSDAGIFIIVANPTDETVLQASAYDGFTLAKTSYKGGYLPEFCSCARLAYAPDALEIINAPVVFIDINSPFHEGSGEIISGAARSEVTLIDTGSPFPADMFSASIAVSYPSEAARAFWSVSREIILNGLVREGPLLAELAGVSLYAAACSARNNGHDINIIPASDGAHELFKEGPAVKNIIPAPIANDNPGKAHELPRQPYESRFNDADKLFDFIANNKGDDKVCNSAVIDYARSAAAPEVHAMLARCGAESLNPVSMAYGIIAAFAREGDHDIISSLFETSCKNDRLFGIFSIGQAMAECARFESASCARLLSDGMYRCLKNGLEFSGAAIAIRNAAMMEPEIWPSSKRYPEFPFTLIHRNTFDDAPYTLFLQSSREYFIYWEERIENIRNVCGNVNVCIVLANPSDEAINATKSRDGVSVCLFHSPFNRYVAELTGAMMATMNRDLIKLFDTPVIYVEMDSTYPPGMGDVFSFMARQKFVYTQTNIPLPNLITDSAVWVWNTSEESRVFSELYSAYLLETLARIGDIPIYTYDQVCRYRAICRMKKLGYDMLDLNKHLGGKWRYWFKDFGDGGGKIPIEDRLRTRVSENFSFKGINEERRTVWERKGEMNYD